MGDGRFVACCVIKIQNKLKYNFSGRVSLLQVDTVTGIKTNCFENFQRFELWRVIFPENFPRESRIASNLRQFRIIKGSRNRGLNYSVRVKQIQGKRHLVRIIGRFEKPRVRESGINAVYCLEVQL